jgi:hypothetical protein
MTAVINNEDIQNTDSLVELLKQNQSVDFLTMNLQDEENVNKLNFTNLTIKPTVIIFQIKAFQRLIRIIPESNPETALQLLRLGIHSALQIAAMTRKDYMNKCKGIIDEKLADTIYHNALAKRSTILVQYMNMLQNSEPHISSARFK